METKAQFIKEIRQYKDYDVELIGRAYDKAKQLHAGQLRKSGEPYMIHPIAVAIILAQLGMDDETLVGGLLHDVVEDTEYTREQLVEFQDSYPGQLKAENIDSILQNLRNRKAGEDAKEP